MIPSDSRLQAAVQSAIGTVKKTVAEAAERVVESLGLSALTSASNKQKQAFNDAQYELRRKLSVLQSVFDESLRESVAADLAGGDAAARRNAATDWQSLSLVDDRQVEEQVAGDRIAQAISHECEWELRELAGYMGSLLQRSQAEPRRNPLRPEALGRALYRGIEVVSDKEEIRSLVAKELGQTVARAMRSCYTNVVADLQTRGVQPAGLTVKQTAPSGVGDLGMEAAAAAPSSAGLAPRPDAQRQAPRMRDADRAQFIGRMFGVQPAPSLSEDSALDATAEGALNTDYRTDGPYGDASMSNRLHPNSSRQDTGPSAGPAWRNPASGPQTAPMSSRHTGNTGTLGTQHARTDAAALDAMARHVGQDVHLMALIRRLTEMASRSGELDAVAHGAGGRPGEFSSATAPLGSSRLPFGATGGGSTDGGADLSETPLAGLMAVNLIRAHRDELRQASPGALDHMVIDVVSSLFDQILSDPKVPPQMARQIARLQLPVLRVALTDVGFFSSRRHPVRRFVNRIASLACAFDDFNDGPGRTFLAEVSALVRDIVEGDFDQMAVYEAKLASLEAFIGQQNEQAVEAHGNAASLLGAKETELRLQQRYTQQLTTALAEVATPEFIREFLAQVWSQAMMTAARQHGTDAPLAQRYRQAARNLVTSVQPKGTPALRKAFLLQLPPLMKDLNEGLDLIGWPAVARKEFFGKLLPLHAESLKGQSPTELQQNLLNKQLEGILGTPVPRSEELSRSDALPVLTDEVVEQKFSKEEVAHLGLVEERSVDWDGLVDIDLGVELEASESTPVDLELDIGTATTPAELPEPSQGPQLMDHVKLGFAYRMHLKGAWTKVRLSYVSPGRAFFVFTHGKKHQETLSMTARMLARMCETGRLRAFENAYLIERATARARKQLAALAPAGKH